MIWLISKIGILLIYLIGKTLRIKITGEHRKNGAIFIFWHSDSFAPLYAYRFNNITILISTHRDGEYIARISKRLGYKSIRGATKDSGTKAFIKLLKIKDGTFAITPDGPKGPRHSIQPGVIKLAEFTKLPIVPVGIYISNKIRFNSWDKYQLPLPFAKCIIYMGKAIFIEKANIYSKNLIKNALIKSNIAAEKKFAQI